MRKFAITVRRIVFGEGIILISAIKRRVIIIIYGNRVAIICTMTVIPRISIAVLTPKTT